MTSEKFPFEIMVTPLAESAVLIRIGDCESIEPSVVDAVGSLTGAVDRARIAGVVDVVPAYATILISFDPEATDGGQIEHAIREIVATGVSTSESAPRTVIIPVAYGDDFGPDLAEVASVLSLTPDRVIDLHASAEYQVAFMGFSPGWAYLMGTPPELAIARRHEPRTRVPAGSVSLGGGQTGVYPSESPGGWHLLGRTPLRMFDPDRSEPFLLQPRDHVRFVPISAERFAAMANTGE